jgi:hypothetical protein
MVQILIMINLFNLLKSTIVIIITITTTITATIIAIIIAFIDSHLIIEIINYFNFPFFSLKQIFF